jgi:hypothetical protein
VTDEQQDARLARVRELAEAVAAGQRREEREAAKPPPPEPERRGPGRPRKELPIEKVEELAERGWYVKEIAAFFGCSHDVVSKRYGEVIREAKQRGKGKIRDMLWSAAQDGDIKAITHLARHRLGEHDQQHLKVEKMGNDELVKVIQARLEADKLLPAGDPDVDDPVGTED